MCYHALMSSSQRFAEVAHGFVVSVEITQILGDLLYNKHQFLGTTRPLLTHLLLKSLLEEEDRARLDHQLCCQLGPREASWVLAWVNRNF